MQGNHSNQSFHIYSSQPVPDEAERAATGSSKKLSLKSECIILFNVYFMSIIPSVKYKKFMSEGNRLQYWPPCMIENQCLGRNISLLWTISRSGSGSLLYGAWDFTF